MTRTVADAAAELGAIAGKDPEDPATATAPATVPDYLAGALADGAGRQADRRDHQHQRAVRRGGRRRPGARRDDGHGRRRRAPTRRSTSSRPEFKRDLNAYLGRLPASAPMKTLTDIIDYNAAHPADATQVRAVAG